MRYNVVTVCLGCVIAVLIGVILYMYSTSKGEKENMDATQVRPLGPQPGQDRSSQPKETNVGDVNSPAFVLFHATWCPHCTQVLPLFQQLQAGAKGGIQIMEIESKNPLLTKLTGPPELKLDGFPTIRFYPQGISSPEVFQKYEGPRSLDGFVQFLSSL